MAERRRADQLPTARVARRAADAFAGDRVARFDAKFLAAAAIQNHCDDAVVVLLDCRLLVLEEQRHVRGGLAVSFENRFEHDLRRDTAGARRRADDTLDMVGVICGAQRAELVATEPRVERHASRHQRGGVDVLRSAELAQDLHGAHVEVGGFGMRGRRRMLLHQHAVDALLIQMQRRRQSDGPAADDQNLRGDRAHGRLAFAARLEAQHVER